MRKTTGLLCLVFVPWHRYRLIPNEVVGIEPILSGRIRATGNFCWFQHFIVSQDVIVNANSALVSSIDLSQPTEVTVHWTGKMRQIVSHDLG